MTASRQHYGIRLEAFFRKVISAAGIRQAEDDFTPESLRLDAQLANPIRLHRVQQHVRLEKASPPQLLDHLFGIDFLVDVNGNPSEPVYAAIDLTCNRSKVASKMSKALSLRKMWQQIGVAQFFVIHLEGDPEDLTPAGAEQLTESLWQQMEAAFNGPACMTHAIHLRVA